MVQLARNAEYSIRTGKTTGQLFLLLFRKRHWTISRETAMSISPIPAREIPDPGQRSENFDFFAILGHFWRFFWPFLSVFRAFGAVF